MAEERKKAEKRRGTILRGADGSVYFIRDELLEACRLSGEELELAEGTLAAARKAPIIEGADSVRLEREMPPLDFENIPVVQAGDQKVASTIMCCW